MSLSRAPRDEPTVITAWQAPDPPDLRPSLPLPLTSFVGRDRETADVAALLRAGEVRLVTLTGPGGVGKTRLALRAAEDVAADFADGVWFVPLEPVRDPRIVESAIAQALGVRESGLRSVLDGLATFLHDRRALLVLDNFEHVLDAGPTVTSLLARCRRLSCLITSRAPLRVSAEQEFPVPPLDLPEAIAARADRIEEAAAVRLFVARARAVQPGFALTDANADDVEAICRHLDGLPLAIELAAARVRHLPPAALRRQFEGRSDRPTLDLLSGGPRDAPSRHRHLRDTIAWSHDLLAPEEQVLFRRLAVFAGGFTLEAAEAVAQGPGDGGWGTGPDDYPTPYPPPPVPPSVLDGVAALVDESLVARGQTVDGDERYALLETVREFGLERLATSGDEAAVRDAHAAFFLTFAERAAPELFGPEQRVWLDLLDAEHANLRAALAWLDRAGDEAALVRLAWALLFFWWYRGHLAEGREWSERALARAGTVAHPARAWLTFGAGMMALNLGDLDRIETLGREASALAQAAGQPAAEGMSTMLLAWAALLRNDPAEARRRGEVAAERLRASGEERWLANGLGDVGLVIAHAGDRASGIPLIEEALALDRARGNRYFAAVRLSDLGLAAHDRGDEARAVEYYRESVQLLSEVGGAWYLASPLAGLAAVAAPRDPVRAARLLGAAEALRARSGMPGWPTELARDERLSEVARAALGPEAFARELAAGGSMPLPEVVRTALGAATGEPAGTQASEPAHGLSPRELEVLRLIAAGHSDREVADALFISPRTASKHVGNILAKLGVATRAEAAVFAVRHGLT